jgi:hypothetical protein
MIVKFTQLRKVVNTTNQVLKRFLVTRIKKDQKHNFDLKYSKFFINQSVRISFVPIKNFFSKFIICSLLNVRYFAFAKFRTW